MVCTVTATRHRHTAAEQHRHRPDVAELPAGARHFRSRQAHNLAYETEHLDDRERAWRRVRKCRRQLGSDPDGLGQPYPEKPAGMLPSRYAWLLDRLDAAEDDLGLHRVPRLAAPALDATAVEFGGNGAERLTGLRWPIRSVG